MRAVHASKKGGKLELANREIEAGTPEPGLHHLLQRRFSAANGEKLKPDSPGLRQPSAGRRRRNRKIVWHRGRYRPLSGRPESVDIALDQLRAIDGLAQGAPDCQPVERRAPG